jgi:hypothetical protein
MAWMISVNGFIVDALLHAVRGPGGGQAAWVDPGPPRARGNGGSNEMIRRDDGDVGTTSNRYCERVGLVSVPCVEDVLDRDDVNLFHRMVVALLARGRPMTVEEIAERLAEAGAIARSGDLVLSLKKAWHGREPVCRDPDGRLGLNLSSSELDLPEGRRRPSMEQRTCPERSRWTT